MAFKHSRHEAVEADDKSWLGVVKTYYRLAKPGIIYGNILTTIGGFLFAAKGHPKLWLFVAVVVGTSLVIGSACAFNNFLDQDIDKKMARTKRRALVRGAISGRSALIYASILGVAGFVVLAAYVNWLVVAICGVGFIDYVALYDFSKRHSIYGTLVGSISGAMPIVAGYCAVVGDLDAAAFILFAILVFWQMPHFYAIAMYRFDDYAAASIPVLPVKKGMRATKIQILLYVVGFILAIAALTVFSHASWTYSGVMVALGAAWLWKGVQGFKAPDDKHWARKMFFFSLIIILTLSVMLSVNSFLP